MRGALFDRIDTKRGALFDHVGHTKHGNSTGPSPVNSQSASWRAWRMALCTWSFQHCSREPFLSGLPFQP
jgi:hypothetical protein